MGPPAPPRGRSRRSRRCRRPGEVTCRRTSTPIGISPALAETRGFGRSRQEALRPRVGTGRDDRRSARSERHPALQPEDRRAYTRAQPVSALRGRLHPPRARDRDPHHRARDGQPVRMGRARAGSFEGRRRACCHRRDQAPQEHRGSRRDRRDGDRARSADLPRPQGDVGNLRQGEGAVRAAPSSSSW